MLLGYRECCLLGPSLVVISESMLVRIFSQVNIVLFFMFFDHLLAMELMDFSKIFFVQFYILTLGGF